MKPTHYWSKVVPLQTSVTLIGSCRNLELPRDFDRLFRNGVLVDPRNGTPMEMDAYSAYLALKALERLRDADYSIKRKILVDAVIARMQDCGGFWWHGAWTGSHREIHMRFSAAALRLLCDALNDRIIGTASIVTEALKKHLSYTDTLKHGKWFLHDSLEGAGSGPMHPHRPLKNAALGSSAENCLVLNTHLDTLCTLVYALRRVPMTDKDHAFFRSELASGISALRAALNLKKTVLWRYFAGLDAVMRKVLFASYSHPRSGWVFSIVPRLCRAAIIRLYFPIRHRIRSRLYGFIFPDGYIERDIGLDGIAFEYHVANVYDLSRFLIQAKEFELLECDQDLINQCGRLVDEGIEYASRAPYLAYLIASTNDSGHAILLCETILARLATRENDEPIPHTWIHAYCVLRRKIQSPSAAILGYDPLIVAENKTPVFRKGWDILQLRNGHSIAVDLANETISISSCHPRQ